MLPLKHTLLRTWVILLMFPAREDAVTSGGHFLPFKKYTDGPREQETDTLAPLEIQLI